ncbi:MAG: alpha-glucan family phosphorylase [Elusimicrobiota bacterium]|jgi:starch phosphorylase|nr:alpha-glucan family phosphorylase [Elusimicrobiota bacterium]
MKKDLFDEQQEHVVLQHFKPFVAVPNPPAVLKPLTDITRNMWWCWNTQAVELFRRMSRDLWEKYNHNPTAMLAFASQELLESLANDDSFISNMQRVHEDLQKYMKMETWYKTNYGKGQKFSFAYFSTEFAIHESIPIYSGGLGVLSGDHLKSASDMGLPLVGVGLFYHFGYFKQHLNSDGMQQEDYEENHISRLPLDRVQNPDGTSIVVEVPFPNNQIARVRAWKLQVGRVPLYLLDTDFDDNPPAIREISGELYGGNRDMRIRQEIILGIGGAKLLKALNIEPDVIHINEGHSAFLLYERIRFFVQEKGLTFEQAFQTVKSACVFTTHTPVPAGNEVFDPNLVLTYLEGQYSANIGISREELLQLGAFPLRWGERQTSFSMTILALRFASKANGVSRLHATVARDMWSPLYPGLPKNEVPITYITNGVHTNTWLSYEFSSLFDRYLGSDWKDTPADQSIWEKVGSIPDTELWRAHERRKERLVSFTRERLRQQAERRGLPQRILDHIDEALDSEALTIGFARRFATYKRGDLIFRDMKRFKSILLNKNCPVQMVISGKAHPQDTLGKKIIQQIVDFANDEELRAKIIFLEDYDMNIAHYLVQGVDVWLNNPLRPQEASGTSGMKAALNGVLNLSILDGWWCEGYNGNNGWVIGSTDKFSDREYQDDVDSRSIYELLEKEIVPLYYEKATSGMPRGWIKKMKASMQTLGPIFNTNRMVEQYTTKFYIPASVDHSTLARDDFKVAKEKAQWDQKITDNWSNIKIVSSDDTIKPEMLLGTPIKINARIYLANLAPEDVCVQVYSGNMDTKRVLSNPSVDEMVVVKKEGNDYIYELDTKLTHVGFCAYAIRIIPKYDNKPQYIPERIIWS